MKSAKRLSTPPVLLQGRAKKWSDAFVKRRAANPSAEFAWPQHNGKKLNHHLLPALKDMTQDHCAFCDGYPVQGVSNETIDHFRPKSAFPRQSCRWKNLFYACDCCQGHKRELFEAALLKPDVPSYSFDAYFLYDFTTGRIEPNPAASAPDQHRATRTITILGLNESERPKLRQNAVRRFGYLTTAQRKAELDSLPYRFALV